MVMPYTGFWMIRHALVEENARAFLYGSTDVELCESTLVAQVPVYEALAAILPRPALWLCTPLSRTRRTAEAVFAAGYPAQTLTVVDGLIEQSMGDWHGTPHAHVPTKLTEPAHPFWPLAGTERPPGGESMQDVIARVGATLEHLAAAHRGENIVAVSHGGTIRAAVAHALGIEATNALHLSVQNVSLTRMERHPEGWRVVTVNEMPWV
jgi:broad specificity phosphatase PhoE